MKTYVEQNIIYKKKTKNTTQPNLQKGQVQKITLEKGLKLLIKALNYSWSMSFKIFYEGVSISF